MCRSCARLAQAGEGSTAGCGNCSEDSSSEGCSDFLASASRALQLERAESQKRLPRESCSAGLNPKLRALGSHTRSSCLLEAGEGPTAVTTLSDGP